MSSILRPVWSPLISPIAAAVTAARRNGAGSVLPEFDYLVTLGSSTSFQVFSLNQVLGRQEHPARKSFTDAGFDLPIINKAVSGAVIADLDTNVSAYLTSLGPISSADPSRVAVLVNIGSNDIGVTDYDAMAPATRDAMLVGLNSVVTKIQAFGFTPILATSNSRKGSELLYQEWAEKFYRPAVLDRTPFWYVGPNAVFDYSQFYFDNKDVPNWWNADEVHPWMATQPYQAYTIANLASKSVFPAIAPDERVIIYFPNTINYFGGMNQILGGASGSSSAIHDTKGNLIPGATFGWTGATGVSGSFRTNLGAWDVDLSHNFVQGCTTYASAATITYTANFGAAYANRTGTLRVTSSSSAAGRLTKLTAGANTAVINASGPGVQIAELPFTLNASGVLVFTAMPEAPSTFANMSGVEFVFD